MKPGNGDPPGGVCDLRLQRFIRWLLAAGGTTLILLGVAAYSWQPDRSPAGLGTASDHIPTARESPTTSPTATTIPAPTIVHPGVSRPMTADPFARWNGLEPKDWWTDWEPYYCQSPEKDTSTWIEAGMTDLGGSDSLSLIRFYGNGSYLRYGFMGFGGCPPMKRYPDRAYLDPPVDPAYYSLGDLDIAVDIARAPPDGTRTMGSGRR